MYIHILYISLHIIYIFVKNNWEIGPQSFEIYLLLTYLFLITLMLIPFIEITRPLDIVHLPKTSDISYTRG